MNNPCLNEGHTGAASEIGKKQMKCLCDVTEHINEFFAQSNPKFNMKRFLNNELVPGGIGSFDFRKQSTGECVYFLNNVPVAFITRLHSNSGCDANVGKWYRKQWYFENYLKKLNPHCTHLTFIYAEEKMLNEMIDKVSMVMTQDFNKKSFDEYNHGGNSIFCYDTSKGTDTWYDMQEKVIAVVRQGLIELSKSKKKTNDEGATITG